MPFSLNSRSFPLSEQDGAECYVQNDSLDLARHWFHLELNVVVVGHGGGIANHVDGRGGKNLPLP